MSRFSDTRWMDSALSLARAGLGRTAPNPSVGCIIVRDGKAVGRGATAPGGRPHAEQIALQDAGSAARGATAYVSLEPCAHTGQTPPCADALISAGVGRVVIACRDPDARTAGQGAERLRNAGIAVVDSVREQAARELNAGFFSTIHHKRPLVVIDAVDHGYDMSADTAPGMAFGEWLEQLAGDGVTRLRLVPGSDAELAARSANLIDASVPLLDTRR